MVTTCLFVRTRNDADSQGHSDADEEHKGGGTAVSQQRADAVVAYLTENGIAPARLRATGFGPAFARRAPASVTSSDTGARAKGGAGAAAGAGGGRRSDDGSGAGRADPRRGAGAGAGVGVGDGVGAGAGVGAGTGGKARTLARASNRTVAFHVIQELEVRGTVEFGRGSAVLHAMSYDLLNGVVALLATRPHLSVRVEVSERMRSTCGRPRTMPADPSVVPCGDGAHTGSHGLRSHVGGRREYGAVTRTR